jgi:Lon protease-like protein
MRTHDVLGLFPLELVLFPGAYVPLHIFEPRYRQLIRECIEQRRPFGINLYDKDNLQRVGCTAEVQGIVRQYEDGRFDIVVQGGRRYILQSLDQRAKPYLLATVEYYDDYPGETLDLELYRTCAELFNEFVKRVYSKPEVLTLPVDRIPVFEGSMPSFFMAQKSGLRLLQKQVLLAFRRENDRLDLIRQHLAELLPRLDQAEEIERISRTDGYLISGSDS